MAEHGWLGPIEWAAAARPLSSEEACGDYPVAVDVGPSAALFGVLDGLGHGGEAARAAQRAAEVLRDAPDKPLGVLVQLCHRALADTRGVAMTLARIEFEADLLSWTGIGNVTADLVVKSPGGVGIRSSARLAGGIVGYRIPDTVHTQTVSMRPGDLLVMTTDGIGGDFLADIDFSASAVAIADQTLRRYRKDNDDALVLAARHRGASG
ncbi:MAG TPA: SpoIIE family protein phosphatase [Mycobacterium sp.]|uniref:SpoIIE family protein phosphatase n=1 Tax=Mycobacterium sp. TaxID=1785 RepID=UPI002C407045|nr:SpoIIE family protein phosphatase [Mycobacterium sp.]HME76823.1 SpoIIE family protein phosphatase [Mycobacterium sp.]